MAIIDNRRRMGTERPPIALAQNKRLPVRTADRAAPPGEPCPKCQGLGFTWNKHRKVPSHTEWCHECDGVGFFGIDPLKPCHNERGSNARVAVYAARYAAGLPLYHPDDYRPAVDEPTPQVLTDAEHDTPDDIDEP